MKKISVKFSFVVMFLLIFSTSVFAQSDMETVDVETTVIENVSLEQNVIVQPFSKVDPSLKNTNFSGSIVNVHGINYPGYINVNKQRKHIPNTPEYIPGRSIFQGTVDDATVLFYRNAGMGVRVDAYKERISAPEYIGIYIKNDGSGTPAAYPTRNAIIHYSNTGAHIVPAAP